MNDRHFLIRLSDVLMIVSFALAPVSAPFQALFYASLFFSALDRLFHGNDRRRILIKTDILPAVFLGIALVGAWTARYHLAALEGTAVCALYAAVYLLSRSYPMDERRHRLLSGAAAVGLAAASVFALIHFFLIREAIRLPMPVLGHLDIPASSGLPGQPVLASIFLDPSRGGLILGFLSVFLGGYILGRGRDARVWERIGFPAAILLGLAALLLTRSWGAYVFTAVAGVILLLMHRKFALLVLPVLFVAIVVFTQGESVKELARDPFASPSWKGRMLQYGTGLDTLIERNPIWGIGLGNFQYAYFESESTNADFERNSGSAIVTNGPGRELFGFREYRIGNMPVNALQNAFLSLLTETGVTGLLTLVLFWAGIAASGLRDFRRQGDPVSAAAVAVLGGFFAHSLFWNMLNTVPVSVLVLWLAGLSRNRALKELWRIPTDHD